MRTTLAQAREHGVAVGAHPGLPDLIGFGRRNMDVTPDEVYDLVVYQVGALLGFARAAGVRAAAREGARRALQHGGGQARARGGDRARGARRRSRARAVRSAGQLLISEGEAAGLTTAGEAFADRNYMSDGTLVSRRRPDAQVHDADEAVRARSAWCARARCARSTAGRRLRVDTICIHGDGPHAAEFAQRLRAAFKADGIDVRAMGRRQGQ